MITIRNHGPIEGAGPDGWHNYQVKVGHRVVVRFLHRKSDGLATCLRRAAAAVDREAVSQKG